MKTHVVLAVFVLASATTGNVYKRVKGGHDCTDDEPKTFVFLEQPTKDKKIYQCSGTVIGDGSWVLTAAHCNETNLAITIKDMKKNTVTVDTSQLKKYPNHDIMLIKLPKTLSAHMNLPERDACGKAFELGVTKLVIVGRKSETDVMCMDTYAAHNATTLWPREIIFFTRPDKSCTTCGGDSGGAVLHDKILRGVHVGKNRYGYTVAMDVCHYKQWIEETMKKT